MYSTATTYKRNIHNNNKEVLSQDKEKGAGVYVMIFKMFRQKNMGEKIQFSLKRFAIYVCRNKLSQNRNFCWKSWKISETRQE
jgi:hypothetical protein